MAKEDLENLTKKERKEYEKALKSVQGNKERRTRIVVTAIVIIGIVLAGAGIFLLANSKSTSNIQPVGELVEAMPAPDTATHIAVGQEHVPYSTNPPTSGPHYNQAGYGPIECKVFTEEVADEGAIHNLEHGAVWVTYQDKNDTQLADQLKTIVEDYSKTLLSPRSANDSKIAVVAWRHILKLDQVDEQKIKDFIRLYRNSQEAPEPLAACGTHTAE